MDLVQDLMKNLGVGEDAAKGGAGLIFKLAQDKLPTEDFSKVTGAVPEVGDLIKGTSESGGSRSPLRLPLERRGRRSLEIQG